jgi:uncharacterized protein YcfJ
MLLPSKKNTNNAEKLMRAYLKDVHFYGSIKDIIAVKNIINLRTGASAKTLQPLNNRNDNDSGKLMQLNFKHFSPHTSTLNSNINSSPTATIKRTQPIDNTVKLLGRVNKHSTEVNKVKYERDVRATKTSVNRKKLGANIGASISASIGANIGTSIGANIGTSIGANIGTSIGANIGTSIGTTIVKASKTYVNKTSKFTLNSLIY